MARKVWVITPNVSTKYVAVVLPKHMDIILVTLAVNINASTISAESDKSVACEALYLLLNRTACWTQKLQLCFLFSWNSHPERHETRLLKTCTRVIPYPFTRHFVVERCRSCRAIWAVREKHSQTSDGQPLTFFVMSMFFNGAFARAPCVASHLNRPNVCKRRSAHLSTCMVSNDISERIRAGMASVTGDQVALGSVLGFSTGFAIKRIGQVLLVIVGFEVIALQLMVKRGWVVVDWNAFSRDISPHVEDDAVKRFMETIKIRAPFAGSFSAGCYAGFRWS